MNKSKKILEIFNERKEITYDQAMKIIGEIRDAIDRSSISNPDFASYLLNYLQANIDDITDDYANTAIHFKVKK